jgi:UDP-N-acetylglucosamine 4,6-dehydratase
VVTPFPTILILGGTGSLGQALTRFLLDTTDATIRILSRGELLQAEMQQTFRNHPRLRFFLGDIRDLSRLHLACHGADLVILAAALKHIDRSEYDPLEFIETNVNGTKQVAQACRTMNVRRAVFIGTDKAIHSENAYGMTKALAEKLWIRANGYTPHETEYVAVRYANVFGSRGSVKNIWHDALARGEQPGLTDVNMTRFHLTLEDAVQLVWFAAQYAPRGSILVPHVPAYRVVDLYEAVCGDVPYRIIGTRPGEKLHEELATEGEMARAWLLYNATTKADPYFCLPPVAPSWAFPRQGDFPLPEHWNTGILTTRPLYRSDYWSYRLSAEDLRERLGSTSPC